MRTKAEQKRVERQRRKDAGLVFFGTWVLPKHRAKLKQIVKELSVNYSINQGKKA